jgi:hypothetical protein
MDRLPRKIRVDGDMLAWLWDVNSYQSYRPHFVCEQCLTDVSCDPHYYYCDAIVHTLCVQCCAHNIAYAVLVGSE